MMFFSWIKRKREAAAALRAHDAAMRAEAEKEVTGYVVVTIRDQTEPLRAAITRCGVYYVYRGHNEARDEWYYSPEEKMRSACYAYAESICKNGITYESTHFPPDRIYQIDFEFDK